MLQHINREQNMRNVWKEIFYCSRSLVFLFVFVHFFESAKKTRLSTSLYCYHRAVERDRESLGFPQNCRKLVE